MVRRFDEGINAQWRDVYENHPEYQFRSDLYMAYHDRRIELYRLKRDEILNEVTDAAGESTKTPRLQRALQVYDENFDVIGLINFNWGHTLNKPLNIDDHHLRERRVPQQTHHHQEQVCHPLSSRPREDVPIVWNGAEDYTSVAQPAIQRSGYAQSPQGCFAAMANVGGDEVVNRLWHQQHLW